MSAQLMALEMKDKVDDTHAFVVAYCHVLLTHLQKDYMDEADLTDIGYLLRECEKFLDDARKEVQAKKDVIS